MIVYHLLIMTLKTIRKKNVMNRSLKNKKFLMNMILQMILGSRLSSQLDNQLPSQGHSAQVKFLELFTRNKVHR